MPSFGDMLEVVDLLKVDAVECDDLKCVAVRNRNSKCKKCVDACIVNAITVSHNEWKLDSAACVNCGCCIAVCPTGALQTIEPSQAATKATLIKRASRESGMAVLACERKVSRREGDPDKYASVPCLGYVTEEMLLDVAAAGYDDIVLVDGDCATCKFGAASSRIDASVENAIKLIEAAESGELALPECASEPAFEPESMPASASESMPASVSAFEPEPGVIITRTSEWPPEVVDTTTKNVRGKSRRGIMRQTGNYVKTVAGNVAMKTLEDKLGGPGKEPLKLHDRLRAGKSGRIPSFRPNENYALIDAMAAIAEREKAERDTAGQENFGQESGVTLNTRHFGDVSIDAKKCSGCGMCVLFCPTDALKYAEFDEPADENMRYLEFQASDCTQCMLCKDVCLRYCLEVSPVVSLRELVDFEPKLIEILKPQNRTNLLNIKNRNRASGK